MRVVLVAAARPNFMKVAPVLRALDVEVVLVHSGQHHDAEMSGTFFDELDLRQPICTRAAARTPCRRRT